MISDEKGMLLIEALLMMLACCILAGMIIGCVHMMYRFHFEDYYEESILQEIYS